MKKVTVWDVIKSPARYLVKGHLPSNTWPGRNGRKIKRMEEALVSYNLHDITVNIIGPGAVAEKYRDSLPTMDEEDPGLPRWKQPANFLETRERDKPDSVLTCFEPREIQDAFSARVGVREIRIIDKYERVLEGVKRLNLQKVLILPPMDIDLVDCPALPEADVSIFYHFLEYCKNPEAAFKRVADSARAFIGTTYFPEYWPNYADKIEGFERVWANVYAKKPSVKQ